MNIFVISHIGFVNYIIRCCNGDYLCEKINRLHQNTDKVHGKNRKRVFILKQMKMFIDETL